MALDFITDILINGNETLWTPSNLCRSYALNFQAGAINEDPYITGGSDNNYIKFTSGNNSSFSLDLGNGLIFRKQSGVLQRDLILNDVSIKSQQAYTGNQSMSDTIIFMSDDTTEEAYMVEIYGYFDYDWYRYYTRFSYYPLPEDGHEQKNRLYNWIKGQAPVSYNWQSVPSISGKNGILQPLSSHLDINDGEPITTSDTTKYSLNSNSNINKLVQDKLNS